jgi:hypothetical protein
MLWEGMRHEADRATREGEMARDRHVMCHARELDIERDRRRDATRAERGVRWLVRVAQAAASWLA